MNYTLYDSDGRPYEPIDLADQFAKFAATITGKKREPIGTGNESSPLSEHGNRLLIEKEKE